MPDLPPRDFLDRLTNLYNLQWYYDGLVLYASAANEARSRLLVLKPISFDAFKAALDALNISDERYVERPPRGNRGPPLVVALVDQRLNGRMAERQARPRSLTAEKPLGHRRLRRKMLRISSL